MHRVDSDELAPLLEKTQPNPKVADSFFSSLEGEGRLIETNYTDGYHSKGDYQEFLIFPVLLFLAGFNRKRSIQQFIQ